MQQQLFSTDDEQLERLFEPYEAECHEVYARSKEAFTRLVTQMSWLQKRASRQRRRLLSQQGAEYVEAWMAEREFLVGIICDLLAENEDLEKINAMAELGRSHVTDFWKTFCQHEGVEGELPPEIAELLAKHKISVQ